MRQFKRRDLQVDASCLLVLGRQASRELSERLVARLYACLFDTRSTTTQADTVDSAVSLSTHGVMVVSV